MSPLAAGKVVGIIGFSRTRDGLANLVRSFVTRRAESAVRAKNDREEAAKHRETKKLLRRALQDNTHDGTVAFNLAMEIFKTLSPDFQVTIVEDMVRKLSSLSSYPFYDVPTILETMVIADFFSGLPDTLIRDAPANVAFKSIVSSAQVTETFSGIVDQASKNETLRITDKEKVSNACTRAVNRLSEKSAKLATITCALKEANWDLVSVRLGETIAIKEVSTLLIPYLNRLTEKEQGDKVPVEAWPSILTITASFAAGLDLNGATTRDILVKFANAERPGAKEKLAVSVEEAKNMLTYADDRQFIGACLVVAFYQLGLADLKQTLEEVVQDMAEVYAEPTNDVQRHNAAVMLGMLARIGITPPEDSGVTVTSNTSTSGFSVDYVPE